MMPRFRIREGRVFRFAEDERVIEMGAVSYWNIPGLRGTCQQTRGPAISEH